MSRPLVAIVGRPNVGKSMLFNKLCGRRLSIVEDTPGVTRDRLYAECEWCGRTFDIVDTGGIEPSTDNEILLFMREQAQLAIDAADVVVLVTEIGTGVTAADQEVANMLLRSKKPVVLAVNTLLLQLYLLFSYVMDGFAYAGEAVCGRYYGARNRAAFSDTLRRLFVWGGAMVVLFTAVYAIGGTPFLRLLTSDGDVIAASAAYFPWAVAIPAAGVAAFVWDGVFVGITATRAMLVSLAVAAASFFGVYMAFHSAMGNHALWLAMIVYLFMRGLTQTAVYAFFKRWLRLDF